jgi:hypothetical protein
VAAGERTESLTPTLRVRGNGGDAVLDEQAWVFDADGTVIERPPVDDELNTVATSWHRTIEDQARLYAVPIPQGRGTVVVGVSLAPYERTKLLAAIGTLLLCELVVAAGAFLTRRAVGTALRPLPT